MGTTRAARRPDIPPVLVIVAALAAGVSAGAGDAWLGPVAAAVPRSCRDEPRLHALDFWLGRWVVSVNGEPVGNNVIESMLDGCAITERWTDARGRGGFSLFFYDRSADAWKQVWVTGRALAAGGTKQKSELRELTTPSRVRFQGSYRADAAGIVIQDRTTLTREAPDRVRQLIEVSTDGGKTWKTTFDGVYRRAD